MTNRFYLRTNHYQFPVESGHADRAVPHKRRAKRAFSYLLFLFLLLLQSVPLQVQRMRPASKRGRFRAAPRPFTPDQREKSKVPPLISFSVRPLHRCSLFPVPSLPPVPFPAAPPTLDRVRLRACPAGRLSVCQWLSFLSYFTYFRLDTFFGFCSLPLLLFRLRRIFLPFVPCLSRDF
jgi:hypothetical protein